jgi:hypothetical protein
MAGISKTRSAAQRSHTARWVGLVVAFVLGVVMAIAPFGDWWGAAKMGGFGLGFFAIPTAGLLAVWRAPRLIWAPHAIALREATVFAVLAVPLGAFLVALGGMVEIVVRHSDIPILAPLAGSLFGMFIIGPPALLIAIPFTVVWSEVVRAILRRVLEQGPEHPSTEVGRTSNLRAYLAGEGLSHNVIHTGVVPGVHVATRHDQVAE